VRLPKDLIEAGCVRAAQVVGVALQLDAAVAHHHHGVEDRLEVVHQVRGDQQERVLGQGAQDAVEDELPGGRVDARDGLVEQEHPRDMASEICTFSRMPLDISLSLLVSESPKNPMRSRAFSTWK